MSRSQGLWLKPQAFPQNSFGSTLGYDNHGAIDLTTKEDQAERPKKGSSKNQEITGDGYHRTAKR